VSGDGLPSKTWLHCPKTDHQLLLIIIRVVSIASALI
jgi:hypothetical protein